MATHVVQQNQTQTVTRTARLENLNKCGALTGGITQLVCSGLSVVLGGVAIAVESCSYASGTPMWCGLLFYLPAGLLGVLSGIYKLRGLIIGCIVMCILATIFSISAFSVNVGGVLLEGDYCYCYPNKDEYGYCAIYTTVTYTDNIVSKRAINVILTIVAVLEFLAAIYTSVMMCHGTNCCCCTSSPAPTVAVVSDQTIPATTTQVIQAGYTNTGYQPSVAVQLGQPGY